MKVSAAERTAYDASTVLQLLERAATKKTRDGMARFGIPSHDAYGVAMKDIQAIARRVGRNHALALELWDTKVYEARMLTAFVDETEHVTATQMDRWCRDFDNWAVCDTLCFKLWDQVPHAWKKVGLAESKNPAARWVGRDAVRELTKSSRKA